MAKLTPAPHRQRVSIYLTPTIGDLLFYESEVVERGEHPEYGTAHPSTQWPHHRLVFVSSVVDGEVANLFKYFYAADREHEDDYNWVIGQGEEVNRYYLVRRSLYYARSVAEAAAVNPPVDGEFTHPVVATADSRFAKYGFADDTVLEAPEELKSLYVVVKRRYIEPVTVDYQWSDQLERNIRITKTIIPAGSQQPPTGSVPGETNEIQNGNVFYDVLINQEIVLNEVDDAPETYPLALPSLPSTYNRKFPARLDSVALVGAWAWASSSGVPDSYSEDYYFKFFITEPKPGPYQATALRFITNDPTALQATYPVLVVPTPVTESIAVVAAWFYASTDGNQTFATAKEWSIPETIHDEIELVLGGNVEARPTDHSVYLSGDLPATPGYATFIALSTVTVEYDVKPAPLGLFEVTVLQISLSNLYGGSYVAPTPAPTSLAASTVSDTEIDLSWTPPPSTDGYLIFRSLDGVTYALVSTISPASSFSDTGLTPDTEYFYKIRSFVGSSVSSPTLPDSATTDP